MKRCVAWGPGQRSSVWHARYSGFPTQKLSEKGQVWSFWVFKEASLHSLDWLMGSTFSLQGWDWKFCLITGLVFLAANPHPWMGAKSHLPWSGFQKLRMRDQIPFHCSGDSKRFGNCEQLWMRTKYIYISYKSWHFCVVRLHCHCGAYVFFLLHHAAWRVLVPWTRDPNRAPCSASADS